MASEWFTKELKNRNFLSPIGFKFLLDRAPKTIFFCQEANIPSISLGTVDIPTPFKAYPIDGNITYGSLELSFLVDEDLENYLEIHNWIRVLGVPDNFEERSNYIRENTNSRELKKKVQFSDGTLQVLNNNLNANFDVVYKDLFPTELSTLNFNVTADDVQFFTAQVSFAYTLYEIRSLSGGRRQQ
jgi:hypothetical protein